MKKDLYNEIEYINKIFSFKKEMTIIYKPTNLFKSEKNAKSFIRIFGDKFVQNNKYNCFLFINNKKEKLCHKYYFKKIPEIFIIKLIENKPIKDISYMFSECNYLFYLPDFSDLKIEKIDKKKYLFYHCYSLIFTPDILKYYSKEIIYFNLNKLDHYELIFILLGSSCSDKTSLFMRLKNEMFFNQTIATIGIEKMTITLEIKNEDNNTKNNYYDISIIDTAGAQRFRSIVSKYYKNQNCFILLYDITYRITFEEIGSFVKGINEEIDRQNCIIYLLGMKIDKLEDSFYSRVVEIEEAEQICQKNNLIWGGEYSSKTGSQEDLLNILKDIIYKLKAKLNL